jgi:hypothetical protein
VWKGTVEVNGARLREVETPGFENVYLESATVAADRPQVVRFHVETRGRSDTMLLHLDGATASTVLRFHLEPTTEYGFAPVLVRPPADLPGADFDLQLGALENSRLEQRFEVGPHVDRITVQVIDPQAPLDQEFAFRDTGETKPGDYYYVRVSQLDGGRAWSSPFWVGRAP